MGGWGGRGGVSGARYKVPGPDEGRQGMRDEGRDMWISTTALVVVCASVAVVITMAWGQAL